MPIWLVFVSPTLLGIIVGMLGEMSMRSKSPGKKVAVVRTDKTKSMWSFVFSWPVIAFIGGAVIAIGFGVLSMNPPESKIAISLFSVGYSLLLFKLCAWIAFERSESSPEKALFIGIVCASAGVLWYASIAFAAGKIPQSKAYQGPRIAVQLLPGLSVHSKDVRATGAVITIWNARAVELKDSYILIEMPPIQTTKYFPSDKNPERLQIMAGEQAGSRFVELRAKELSPSEHHSIEVTFQDKQDVGSFNEWREKYHYGSEIELMGQYVVGSTMTEKDLAK